MGDLISVLTGARLTLFGVDKSGIPGTFTFEVTEMSWKTDAPAGLFASGEPLNVTVDPISGSRKIEIPRQGFSSSVTFPGEVSMKLSSPSSPERS